MENSWLGSFSPSIQSSLKAVHRPLLFLTLQAAWPAPPDPCNRLLSSQTSAPDQVAGQQGASPTVPPSAVHRHPLAPAIRVLADSDELLDLLQAWSPEVPDTDEVDGETLHTCGGWPCLLREADKLAHPLLHQGPQLTFKLRTSTARYTATLQPGEVVRKAVLVVLPPPVSVSWWHPCLLYCSVAV